MFQPKRFKVLHGGRMSGKSHSFARLMLFMGTQKPLRMLACREVLTSMKMSVHKLLSDSIHNMGLDYFYEIERDAIYGKNDEHDRTKCTEIRFAGLKTNISSIRSYEGIDVAWLEECHDVSRESLQVLIPTIRGTMENGRPMDSEIWFSFNPRFSSDPVYSDFVMDPPPNATVIRMNYVDNPFLSKVNLDEIERMKDKDYEQYSHVYLGTCQSTVGSIYAKEIRKAEANDQFRNVKYDPKSPVQAFYDLGYQDSTVVMLAQIVPGGEIHILDCKEYTKTTILEVLKDLQGLPFIIAKHHLPWDGAARALGSGLSIEEMIRNTGQKVVVTPKSAKIDQINAVRASFPSLYFDSVNCEQAIQMIRMYRYAERMNSDGTTKLAPEPVHDMSSHFCDALANICMSIKKSRTRPSETKQEEESVGRVLNNNRRPSRSWMAM